MKKTVLLSFFLVVLVVNIIAVELHQETLGFVSKVLLIPVLTIYFLAQTKSFKSNLKPWLILALFFSWVGDALLLFQEKNSVFFLLGLSAFLLAQVSYIIFFHGIRMREYLRGNALLLLPVVVYYSALISVLSPFLGGLKVPVQIYGVVLSFMWMLAMHTMLGKNRRAGVWMTIGAILFVTSDSLLAFNKFYAPWNHAEAAIMLTYGLAQMFITYGAALYIRSEKTQ